jgi:glycine cleavage system H lipoate-binding protein
VTRLPLVIAKEEENKMVALLIVLMFASFIAADYLSNREKYRLPMANSAKNIPEVASLHFHPAHTWAAAESDQVARIGLDAFAARVLPTPSKVDAPRLARWVSQGSRGFSLHFATEGGERDVTLLSPVDGEVVEVNREVLANPSLLKSDPYGKGWLLKLRSPDMAVSIRNLFGPELLQAWTDDSIARLRQFFVPAGLTPAMVTAQDGGSLVDSLAGELDEENWKKLTAEIFRS